AGCRAGSVRPGHPSAGPRRLGAGLRNSRLSPASSLRRSGSWPRLVHPRDRIVAEWDATFSTAAKVFAPVAEEFQLSLGRESGMESSASGLGKRAEPLQGVYDR